ncbi:MAG: redox-regulated ATPase YchF [Chloroflexi bacterium]|nr:redox-regulated ATPase YchF [Chloroflexota bacterium]
MQIGIIGLPTSGKTTIFNALTRGNIAPAAYSSGKFEVHTGVVDVPDDRLGVLAQMFNPRKVTHAKVQYNDVAGLARGAGEKGGLEPALLNLLSQSDALILVIRAFDDPNVPHPDGSVDPARDLNALETELLLADLMAVEKRLQRLKEDAGKRGGTPQEKEMRVREVALFERMQTHLEGERRLNTLGMNEDEVKSVRGFGLLTVKPTMVIYNLAESQSPQAEWERRDGDQGTIHTALRGKLEMEIAQMAPDDAREFLAEYGITEPGLNRIIRLSYDLLGLHSFLTTGEDEVRAWTVRKGATAVEAAGTIHSDLARGFIRAEVIAYADLIDAGGFAEARKRGTLRLEGKTYVVSDGDIVHVKFNV